VSELKLEQAAVWVSADAELRLAALPVPAAESRSEAALHGRIGLRTMRTQIESVGGADARQRLGAGSYTAAVGCLND
jgi:hypothetical protein